MSFFCVQILYFFSPLSSLPFSGARRGISKARCFPDEILVCLENQVLGMLGGNISYGITERFSSCAHDKETRSTNQ